MQEMCGRAHVLDASPSVRKTSLYETMTMQTSADYIHKAKELLSRYGDGGGMKDDVLITVLRYLYLGNDIDTCAALGVDRMYVLLASLYGSSASTVSTTLQTELDIMRILSSLNITALNNAAYKYKILLLASHYGARRAMRHQFTFLVKTFHQQTRHLCATYQQQVEPWPVPKSISLLMEAEYLLLHCLPQEAAGVATDYWNEPCSVKGSHGYDSVVSAKFHSLSLHLKQHCSINVPTHRSRTEGASPSFSGGGLFSPRPGGSEEKEARDRAGGGKTCALPEEKTTVVHGEMAVHTDSFENFVKKNSEGKEQGEVDEQEEGEDYFNMARMKEREEGKAEKEEEEERAWDGCTVGRRSNRSRDRVNGGTRRLKRYIHASGQHLPSGHHAKHGGSPSQISVLTGHPISGCVVRLEDGHSLMTLSEAIMYKECNFFSPLLSGEKLSVL